MTSPASHRPSSTLGDRPTGRTPASGTGNEGSNPSPPTGDPITGPLFIDNLAGQVSACWLTQGERRRVAPECPSSSPPSLPSGSPSGNARSSVAYEGEPDRRRQPATPGPGAQEAGRPNRLAQTWTPLLFVRGRGGGSKASQGRRASAPSVFFVHSDLAQLVEHAAVNRRVAGSSPAVGAEGR